MYSVSRLHFIEQPNILLCFFIFFVSLLSAAQHLAPVAACDCSFAVRAVNCYFATLCVTSSMPSQFTVAAIFVNWTILL